MSEFLKPLFKEYVDKMQKILGEVDIDDVHDLIGTAWEAYQRDSMIFIAGNGGSAATATHIASDIGKNTILDPTDEAEKRFKTFSLTDNVTWVTAAANDYLYEDVFVDQLRNFAQNGDLLLLISGSGNSENVVKAASWANKKGLTTAGLLAFDGGRLRDITKVNVVIPTYDYGLAETAHSFIHHYMVSALRELKEKELK